MSQVQPPATGTDYAGAGSWVCQEFVLPANYVRGAAGEQSIPDLTGVHVFAKVTPNREDAVGVRYRIQRYLFGTGWITEGEGEAVVAEADGDVWMKLSFEQPIEIDENMLDDRWRFCLLARQGLRYREPVEYDGDIAYLPDQELPIILRPDEPVVIQTKGAAYRDAVLTYDPFLYWRFQETGGAAIAGEGETRDGLFADTSTILYGQESLIADESDTAVKFSSGINRGAGMNGPAIAGPNVFTIGCWFETTTTTGGKLMGFGSSSGPGVSASYDRHIYMANDGTLRFGAYNGGFFFVCGPSAAYNDGERHFVVATLGPTGMAFYIDGELIDTDPNAAGQAYSGYWRVGGDDLTGWAGDPTSDWFDGIIDEPMALHSVLTAEQIAELHEIGLSGDGSPSLLTLDSSDGTVYLSEQQGLESVWLSRPNPLATTGFVRATRFDETPIQIGGEDTSLLFRLIGSVADEGVDFLGNQYRHAVKANSADTIASSFGGDSDTYWLSKPNPSRFAVETLYFDMRDDAGDAQVVDRIYVDPITPNVYFNVYYTDQGEPGENTVEWEEKIWNHVPKTFKMAKQENHVLPKPITAKYLAIEFSQLQPRPYAPSFFQQPIRYKKHPRWVLDYFLARTELDQLTSVGNQFVPRQIGITYNAIDLAYNYRLDDLAQEPDAPVIIAPDARNQAVSELGDKTGVVDSQALDQLRLVFNQFQRHPAFFSNVRYLLSDSIQSIITNYPSELPDLQAQQYDVSALTQINKDSLIYEAGMPVMFFFIPCRHRYKEISAQLTHERAYFVGVRQIAFSREKYTVANDTVRYVETMGDAVNMERTDFVRIEGGGYAVYGS